VDASRVQAVSVVGRPHDDDDKVNLFTWQPFVNYNLDGGWYLTTSPLITANWEADSDNTWTVPVGGGVGRIMRFGRQPVNLSLAGFYNVEKPDDIGPEWSIRFTLQLLLPWGVYGGLALHN
jgi:hypothetical protein